MIADLTHVTIDPALSRAERQPVIRTTQFVQRPAIVDRDYVIAAQVKLTGLVAASAVTLITAAIFLFL